jgi:hypothetical protein
LFEQCQATNKSLAFSRKLPRIKSSQRKRKWLIFLPCIAVITNIAITIKVTDVIVTIADMTIIIKTINAMIVVDATTRTQRATSPTTRRIIASTITPRNKATKLCIMTSPLCQVPAICPEEGFDLVQDLLPTLVLVLGLTLAHVAGAMTTIMLTKMIASQAQPPSVSICTPRMTMMDITITRTKAILFLPPSLLRSQRRSAPRNRESCQQRVYVSHCMSMFQTGNRTF